MALLLILLALVLIVAAIRDTQGDLFTALGQDVPAFLVWTLAILLVGALGYVPALRPLSRGLMALVIVALFVNNYQAITANVGALAKGPGGSTNATSSTGTNNTGGLMGMAANG